MYLRLRTVWVLNRERERERERVREIEKVGFVAVIRPIVVCDKGQ